MLSPALVGQGGLQVPVPPPCRFAQTVEVDLKLQDAVFRDAVYALRHAQEDGRVPLGQMGVHVCAHDVGLDEVALLLVLLEYMSCS